MYSYNLIIKRDKYLSDRDADIMVNGQLTRRFGPDVHYYEHAKTDNEVIIVVSNDSKWKLQTVLGEWFTETTDEDCAPGLGYPVGALLHYRQILRDEPTHILNKIGGSAND